MVKALLLESPDEIILCLSSLSLNLLTLCQNFCLINFMYLSALKTLKVSLCISERPFEDF